MSQKLGGKSNYTGFCIYDERGTKVGSQNYRETKDIALLKKIKLIKELGKVIKEKSQWHGVEHKLTFLIKNRLPLTLANLKNAPLQNEACGTDNDFLQEPDEEKLKEALRVGKIYLKKSLPSFFELIIICELEKGEIFNCPTFSTIVKNVG